MLYLCELGQYADFLEEHVKAHVAVFMQNLGFS